MSNTLQIFMIIAEVIYFILIFCFLKRKTLSLKYTLLWLIAGLVMLFFTIFPLTMIRAVKFIGVESAMNGLFALCIFFIIIILMSLTSIASKQSERIRTLTQQIAILEKRVREIEELNEKADENSNMQEGA
ncbi:MAG TPA: DUF2304 domain-containing protein [Lachnospiraceae bacterium]|mgnify:CR=1 FL=1|nr:DUF2304 domain-containing protein [Lachnospiraceae bacterium]